MVPMPGWARSASRNGSAIRDPGTAPPGGEEHLLQVLAEAASHTEAPDLRLPLFFTPSVASQEAGRAFLLFGNGLVVIAEKRVDAGLADLRQRLLDECFWTNGVWLGF